MAHFAELDENNVVKRVLVVNDEYIRRNDGVEIEQLGIDHLKLVYGQDTIWKQTSYNNKIRVRFGQVGFTYNQQYNAFIPPKPHDSWIFNTETCNWDPPVPTPPAKEGFTYVWDENTRSWEEIKLPF